jgi:hypothetical protein
MCVVIYIIVYMYIIIVIIITIFFFLSGIYNPLSLSRLILEVTKSHTRTHHSR